MPSGGVESKWRGSARPSAHQFSGQCPEGVCKWLHAYPALPRGLPRCNNAIGENEPSLVADWAGKRRGEMAPLTISIDLRCPPAPFPTTSLSSTTQTTSNCLLLVPNDLQSELYLPTDSTGYKYISDSVGSSKPTREVRRLIRPDIELTGSVFPVIIESDESVL